MKFFYILSKSVSSKRFYGEIIGGKHPIGFMFLGSIQVLVSLLITTLLSIQVAGMLPELEQRMVQILPEGAEIVLKQGRLQSNTSPITIPFSTMHSVTSTSTSTGQGTMENTDGLAQTTSGDLPTHFLVLDVTASTTESDLRLRDTLILVTTEGIVYGEAGKRVSTNYFSDMQEVSLVIDRQYLIDFTKQIKSIARYMPFVLFIILWVLLYILALVTSLLYGLFVFVLFKIMKIGKGFREAFSIAVYSRGFAFMLGAISIVFPVLMIPLLSILIQILFIILMIRPARLQNIV